MPSIERSSPPVTAFLATITSWPQKVQKRPASRGGVYLGATRYLQDSWLQNVQKKGGAFPSHLSVFDLESELIEALFANREAPGSKLVLQYCNALRLVAQTLLSQQNVILVNATVAACKEQIAQIVYLADNNLEAAAALLDLNDLNGSAARVQEAFNASVKSIVEALALSRKQHVKVPLQETKQVIAARKPIIAAELLMTSSGLLNLGIAEIIRKHFMAAKHPISESEKEMLQMIEMFNRSPEMRRQFQRIILPSTLHPLSELIIRTTLKLSPEVKITDKHARTVALGALLSDMRQGGVGSRLASTAPLVLIGGLRSRILSDFEEILTSGQLKKLGENTLASAILTALQNDTSIYYPIDIDKGGKVYPGRGYLWEAPGVQAACRILNIPLEEIEPYVKSAIDAILLAQGVDKNGYSRISIDQLLLFIIAKRLEAFPSNLGTEELKQTALAAFCAETTTPLLQAWECCLTAIIEAKGADSVRQKIQECAAGPLVHVSPKPVGALYFPAVKATALFKTTVKLQPARAAHPFKWKASVMAHVDIPWAEKVTSQLKEEPHLRPKNAQQLLEAFLLFVRELRQPATNNKQNLKIAFTLTPDNPTVSGGIHTKEAPKKWIDKAILKPGMEIASQPLTESQKTTLINAIKASMLPKELYQAFSDTAMRLDARNRNVHDFSNALVTILSDLLSRNGIATRPFISLQVTTLLIDHILSANARSVLQVSAARIADTNWVDESGRHIYFTCFFDPVTNSLALGTINEDGTNLKMVGQEEWISYVPWEMYGIKALPTLKGRKAFVISPSTAFG